MTHVLPAPVSLLNEAAARYVNLITERTAFRVTCVFFCAANNKTEDLLCQKINLKE